MYSWRVSTPEPLTVMYGVLVFSECAKVFIVNNFI